MANLTGGSGSDSLDDEDNTDSGGGNNQSDFTRDQQASRRVGGTGNSSSDFGDDQEASRRVGGSGNPTDSPDTSKDEDSNTEDTNDNAGRNQQNGSDAPDSPPTTQEDGGSQTDNSDSESGSTIVSGFKDTIQSARDLDQEIRSNYAGLRTDARETFRDVTNTEGVTEAIAERRRKGYRQTKEFTIDSYKHATGQDVDRGVYGGIQDMQEQFDDSNVKTGPGPVLGGFSTAGGSIVNVGKNAKSYVKAARGVEASTIRGSATGERAVGGAVQSGEFVVKGTNQVVNAVKTGSVGTAAAVGSEIGVPENPTTGETPSEIGTPNEAPTSESTNEVEVPREVPGSQSHSEVGVPSEAAGDQQQGEIGVPNRPGDTSNSEVEAPTVKTGAAVPQPGNNQQNTGPGSLPSPDEPSISEEEASTPAVNPHRSGPGFITNGRVSAGEVSEDASKNLAEDVNVEQPSVEADFTGVQKNAVGTSGGVIPGNSVNTDSPPANDSPPKLGNPPKTDSPPAYDSPPRYDSPPETKTPPETTPETGNPTNTGNPNVNKNPNVPSNTTYTPTTHTPPRPPRVPDLDGDVDTGKRQKRKFKFATDTFEADVYTPEEIRTGEAFKGLD